MACGGDRLTTASAGVGLRDGPTVRVSLVLCSGRRLEVASPQVTILDLWIDLIGAGRGEGLIGRLLASHCGRALS